MAKIKAGTYRFNDVLTATDVELNANLNFTVEVSAYGMYEGVAHCDNITVTAEMHNPDMPYRYWYNTMHYNVVDLVPPFEYLSTPVELLMYQTTYYDGEISGIWETDTYSEGIKTITVPYDQDVSAEFAEWFSANAVADGVQISGVWKFKDVLIFPTESDINQDVNYNIHLVILEWGIDTTATFKSIKVSKVDGRPTDIMCWLTDDLATVFDTEGVQIYSEGSWNVYLGEHTQTIDFGTEPQTVSAEFYAWLTENATQPAATIIYNGSIIATLNGGQSATLKCKGMKMESDVVVDVAEQSGGDITVMPLTVTENGVYDILYETATEVWDSNTEYLGSVTVDGVTLSFKKAEHLIVPDDLDELTSSNYSYSYEYVVDGETSDYSLELSQDLSITSGICATLADYAVLWVKSAAPLNAQFGVSFIEDNTAYITNYAQMMFEGYYGAEYVKVSVTAPSKKIENVAYRPVTVELPISEDELYITPLINRATVYDFDRTGQYYKYVQVNAITDNVLSVTPKPTRQELVPQDDTMPFTKVVVEPVDTSSVTTQHLLCGIYIKTMPKTEYKVGEWFDARGGVLLAQYTDGSTEDIIMSDVENNGMVFCGFGSDYPGVIPISVEYTEGAITSKTVYNITIKEDTGDEEGGGGGEQLHVDPETGEILDSWDQIIASVNDGTYSTKYAVGNYKPLDLGNEGIVAMQIAAFDADTLSDESGNAHVTWIAGTLLLNRHIMKDGATNENGWAESDMRNYLANDIWALIPSNVQNSIVEVYKSYYDHTTSSTLDCADKLWLPSYREVGIGEDAEDYGVIYNELFTDQDSRIRTLDGTPEYWWLRSASRKGSEYFYAISDNGGHSRYYSNSTYFVLLGFCM